MSLQAALARLRRFAIRIQDARLILGWSGLLRTAPRWSVERRYLVLVRDLDTDLPAVPALHGLHSTLLEEGDIEPLRNINPRLVEAEVRQRWREGQQCHLGVLDQTPAHFRWDTTRPSCQPYLGLTLLPAEGDALSGYAFTHPAFRGRGLHAAFHAMALRRARDAGCRRSISIVAWWNSPAVRVSQGFAGRKIAGTVGYGTIGFKQWHFATGAVQLDAEGGFRVDR